MARPHTLGGGAKQTFPRAMTEDLMDLHWFHEEIEQAEVIADDPRQRPSIRRQWRDYRNDAQALMAKKISLMLKTSQSHEKAIAGKATPACRLYERLDPSIKELRCMCATSPDAA